MMFALAACSGGGGAPSAPIVTPPPTGADSGDTGGGDTGGGDTGGGDTGGGDTGALPSDFETPEYFAGRNLAPINASAAYARGYTGAGQKIAVIDGPVLQSHESFTDGKIVFNEVAPGCTSCNNDATTYAGEDHGTQAAAMAAGNRDGLGSHGVAYDATLMTIITGSDGRMSSGRIDDALRLAADEGATIVSNSYGSEEWAPTAGEDIVSAAAYATARGAILVFAAGNYGAGANGDNPVATGRMPGEDSSLLGHFVTAVALNRELTGIADYSNRCGSAADWCISAPADVYTANASGDSAYGDIAGTSMATPIVSGALAVIQSAFPTLSDEQVINRMLATANKGGVFADTAVYGQGMLDLGAATAPVGALMVSTPSGTMTPASATAFMLGGAFGGGEMTSLSVALVDSFDHALFPGQMNYMVRERRWRPDYADTLSGFGSAFFASPVTSLDGRTSFIAYDTGRNNAGSGLSAGTAPDDTARAYESRLTLGREATVYAGMNVGTDRFAADISGLPDASGLAVSSNLLTPAYLDQASGGVATGFSAGLGDGVSVAAGIFMSPDDRFGKMGLAGEDRGDQAYVAGIRQRIGAFTIGLELGRLNETGDALDTTGSGGLAITGGDTDFIGVSAAYRLGTDTYAIARYTRGYTDVSSTDASLLTGMSGIVSDAWSLGLMGREGIADGDEWGVFLSQPMRVTRGTMTVSRVVGASASGAILADTSNVSLAAEGRQINYEGWYARPVGGRSMLGMAFRYVTQPGNDPGMDADTALLARYRERF